jgi:hypothetical protein
MATNLQESDLQTAIFTWAGTMLPKHPELEWLHAIPNGGYRTGREAMSLKMQGVKAGILDLGLDVARMTADFEIWHGFKMELKTPKDDKATPTRQQYAYMDFCGANGYYCTWTNDFNMAKAEILRYLNLPKVDRKLIAKILTEQIKNG